MTAPQLDGRDRWAGSVSPTGLSSRAVCCATCRWNLSRVPQEDRRVQGLFVSVVTHGVPLTLAEGSLTQGPLSCARHCLPAKDSARRQAPAPTT